MSAGLAWAALAIVQGPPEATVDSGPIVVTGERSDRSERETASSLFVFTADDMETEAGADRIDQLLEQIPNITLGTTSLGPTIRGQNTTGVLQDLPAFLGGTRPRMTLQVDGRAVGFNEFIYAAAPLWDVSQVEIYRSPQSTTQGRNSIAGAIFVETEDPTFHPEGRARAVYGDIAMSQLSVVGSAPLIDQQLAVRIAGDLRLGHPASRIADRMVGVDPNHDDYGLLRLKFLAEPDAAPGLRVEMSIVHAQSKMPQVENVRAPFKARRDPSPTYGVFGSRTNSITLRADYAISRDLRSKSTVSYGSSRIQRYAPVGLGEAINLVEDWSVEQLLSWRGSDQVRVTTGVHHSRTRLDQTINLTAVLGNGAFNDRQASTGLFGEVEVSPIEDLKITAGLRYQSDSQRRSGGIGGTRVFFPLVFDESFDALLPKLTVAYDLSPQVTAGLLVQRAYNPGGTTINFDNGGPDVFGPEYAWSYELFGRAVFGRASITSNVFHSNFRDGQRAQSRAYSVPGGGTAFWAEIENVPRSRSSGAEVAIDWPLTNRLRFTGGAGLLRTRITRTALPGNPISGKEFQRSPHFTASGSIDWRPSDRLRLTANVRFHSDYFSTDANTPALLIKGHAIANARAAWTAGKLTFFGYARNLLDTFYMTYLGTTTQGTAVDPRELGIGAQLAL